MQSNNKVSISFPAVAFREMSSTAALMKLLLPIEIHVAVCELRRRRTDPQSRVYSYRTVSFKYRCYVCCGTAALHR